MGLGPKNTPDQAPEAANGTDAPQDEIDWEEEPTPEWAAEGDRPDPLTEDIGLEEPVPPDKDWKPKELINWDDPE